MAGFVGEITGFAGNFTIENWSFAHGQEMQISAHVHLFSIVGTIYGGDGRKTFALPELRGRAPIGAGAGPGLASYTLGKKGGTEKFKVEQKNLPPNQVAISGDKMNGTATGYVEASESLPDTNMPGGAQYATFPSGTPVYTTGQASRDEMLGEVKINSFDVQFSGLTNKLGKGQPIVNRSPYQAINWLICLAGEMPRRS